MMTNETKLALAEAAAIARGFVYEYTVSNHQPWGPDCNIKFRAQAQLSAKEILKLIPPETCLKCEHVLIWAFLETAKAFVRYCSKCQEVKPL